MKGMAGTITTHSPLRTQPAPSFGLVSLMNSLEMQIGYKFRNPLLLVEALTHPSIATERKNFPFDNQRLEFLGDSVLQLVVTERLFTLFPSSNEGRLTKLRAGMVSRNNLKDYAAALGLGRHLVIGHGEDVNGGRTRASTLADAFESLAGAIYLDGGLEQVRKFILQQIQSDFENKPLQDSEESSNPKGELQEILQSISATIPEYILLSQSGPEHRKYFQCGVMWERQELGRGTGYSKQMAEKAAASAALIDRAWETPLASAS